MEGRTVLGDEKEEERKKPDLFPLAVDSLSYGALFWGSGRVIFSLDWLRGQIHCTRA